MYFHTPEMKRQSKQWAKEGKPGPIKAKVHASRMKQMVLVFFLRQGHYLYQLYPKGKTVNASYIGLVAALDNAPVYSAASVVDFLVAKGVKMIPHLPPPPH